MYTRNELMFPHYAIAALKNTRGQEWQELVARVLAVPERHELSLAFVLLMIRLNGCLACETDSYRAMRGCALCAMQTLRRFKGTDRDLLNQFEKALEDLQAFLACSDFAADIGLSAT
ncbi:MAG: hypothetical protein OHK0023_21870 [Anaerolineae bacterium]